MSSVAQPMVHVIITRRQWALTGVPCRLVTYRVRWRGRYRVTGVTLLLGKIAIGWDRHTGARAFRLPAGSWVVT